MSKLTIEEVNGKKKGKLEGATLLYIKMQEGSLKYQSKTEKEYGVDCIVDKATAKVFKKAFPKNGVKEVDTPEFESKYKIEPPYPEAEEQFIIKFRVDTALKADVVSANLVKGDDVPYSWASRPKVFIPVEGGVEDITMTKLVANGSTGTVAFKVMDNSFGVFPQMTGILVTDFIEYESSGGASSDFGSVVGGYKEGDGEAQQKASQKPSESDEGNAPTDGINEGDTSSEDDVDEFDDSDIPF